MQHSCCMSASEQWVLRRTEESHIEEHILIEKGHVVQYPDITGTRYFLIAAEILIHILFLIPEKLNYRDNSKTGKDPITQHQYY